MHIDEDTGEILYNGYWINRDEYYANLDSNADDDDIDTE